MPTHSWIALGVKMRSSGNAEQRAPCPQCAKGPRDDALGFNVETGTYHCFRCGWKGRVGNVARNFQSIARIDDPAVSQRKRKRLQLIWKATVSLNHAEARAARNYIETRALGEILPAPPLTLLAHRGLQYWDGSNLIGTYPAMVALFHGAIGQPVTLHVTYLRRCGCAQCRCP